MTPKKVFGIVLAGGEGKRLMPLTEDRAKPAVSFGGQYRLVDFAISNLINSPPAKFVRDGVVMRASPLLGRVCG